MSPGCISMTMMQTLESSNTFFLLLQYMSQINCFFCFMLQKSPKQTDLFVTNIFFCFIWAFLQKQQRAALCAQHWTFCATLDNN